MVRFLLVLIIFYFSIFTSSPSFAENTEFLELKSQYLSLRNTDIKLTRSTEWESLVRRFEQFVDKNPKYPDNASALLNASIMLQILHSQFGGEDRLKRSVDMLERIARDYPGHSLADDALIKKGDLLLYELNNEAGASRAYEEVVRAYPDSELRSLAEFRLNSIKKGTYKNQSKDTGVDFSSNASRKVPLIVIDPGHGGEDFGAQGVHGLLEKDIALALSFDLEKILKEKMKAVVRLTRRSDIFVPLAARTQMANDFDADLFISIHANSSPGGKAKGFEIYFLNNADDTASQALADRENASMQYGESPNEDLQFMLSDLIQSAKQDESIILANTLNDSMRSFLSTRWDSVRGLGVKKAHFYVLVGAHMPCVLVESFFVNNQTDGAMLARKDFRKDVAHSIYLGIEKYFKQHVR